MWHFIILKVFFYILLWHRVIDPVSLKEPQYASNLTVIPFKILMNRASSLCLHTPRDKELTTLHDSVNPVPDSSNAWKGLSWPWTGMLVPCHCPFTGTTSINLQHLRWSFGKKYVLKDLLSLHIKPNISFHPLSQHLSLMICHQCCHYSHHFENSYHFLSTYRIPGTELFLRAKTLNLDRLES